MSRVRVYIGTYTGGESRGIYLADFDQRSGGFASGPLLAGEAAHPSFLAIHPNGRVLYAVNELKTFEGAPTGAVSAFAIHAATGRLTLLNQQPSEGADPCHLAVDAAGRNLLVANYTSGTVALLPLAGDGRLQPASAVRCGSGSGPRRDRQEGPHAHMVALDPAERFAIWADLGSDRLVVDRFAGDAGFLAPAEPGGLAAEPGAGPRHLAWHPSGRVIYLLNELNSTVSAIRFDAVRGSIDTFQTLSARAPAASGESIAAAIAVAAGGRFLYTSNRGDDDMAVFAVDPSGLGLSPVGHVPTGGRTPRHVAIDPSGGWLIASNQGSDSLAVFRLDPDTGMPAPTGVSLTVPEPVCVLFQS